jgi:hypothetical protein
LRLGPDPTVRSYLLERFGPFGADPKVLFERLDQEPDVSIRRALVLSLGGFGPDRLPLAERDQFTPRLLRLYQDEPDAGLHGAAEWLLRRWKKAASLQEIDSRLATGRVEGQRQWYVNRQKQTLTIIPGPGQIWIGAGTTLSQRVIDRTFAIATKEVTFEQFFRFRKNHGYEPRFAPSFDCPVNEVTWYDAAAYCNWLSEQEGIPKDQWCYVPNARGEYGPGMKLAPNFQQRTGYRLPSEAEWEYACRAGTTTTWYCGAAEELVEKYSWYLPNGFSRPHPGGMLKPNDLGMFDMHGNVWEWCQDPAKDLGKTPPQDLSEIVPEDERVASGGSFDSHARNVTPVTRFRFAPTDHYGSVGLRPARTMPAE